MVETSESLINHLLESTLTHAVTSLCFYVSLIDSMIVCKLVTSLQYLGEKGLESKGNMQRIRFGMKCKKIDKIMDSMDYIMFL